MPPHLAHPNRWEMVPIVVHTFCFPLLEIDANFPCVFKGYVCSYTGVYWLSSYASKFLSISRPQSDFYSLSSLWQCLKATPFAWLQDRPDWMVRKWRQGQTQKSWGPEDWSLVEKPQHLQAQHVYYSWAERRGCHIQMKEAWAITQIHQEQSR